MPPQLILGILLAVVAIITYFNQRQTNPVTGERQFVALTPQQEVALGLRARGQMAQQMGGAVDPADPDAQRVRAVGQRIVARTPAAASPYRFEFHLLRDPRTINAFALPGGQIFITRGLYDRLETEAHLAGVLGHEIGHVIHRHSAEHMAKGQLGQMLATAFGVAASDESGRGMSAHMIAQVVNQMVQLKYGRDDERESDSTGLDYMIQSGYDPRGLLRVMQILQQAGGGGRQPEFLSSHPDPGNRLESIQQAISTRFPGGVPLHLGDGEPLHNFRRPR